MKALRRLDSRWLLVPVLLLALVLRFHNLTSVLMGGRVYFVDGDCYSRMSRARLVAESPGIVVRHQTFENWPEGVSSHATAPMDYIIAGLGAVVRWTWPSEGRIAPLASESLDVGGALISPLLGLALCVFAGLWAHGIRMPDGCRSPVWWAVPLVLAVSPALVHATLLGRPDHQSLILVLLGVAIAAQHRVGQDPAARGWAWTAGLAWGGACWVSLFEPVVVLMLVVPVSVWVAERSWRRRVPAGWLAGLLISLAVALAVDRVSIVVPDPSWREALQRWGATIGELQSLSASWTNAVWVLGQWAGAWACIAPVALGWRLVRGGRESAVWLLLVCALGALTVWQIRWNAYFVLAVALAVPWICAAVKGRALQIAAALLALAPMCAEWQSRLNPPAGAVERLHLDRSEWIQARAAAERMRSQMTLPFVAPWWISPAIAYWSGQPAVAGSGHEGIAGIVDSARVFISGDPREVREVLVRRGVRVVVAGDAARELQSSAAILNRQVPELPLAERLWSAKDIRAEWGLAGETNTAMFRLHRVLSDEEWSAAQSAQ